MNIQSILESNSAVLPYVFIFLSLWALTWKGLALWKAAKNNSKIWFVILLVLNTVGIVEILYYFFLYKVDFEKYTKKIRLSPLLSKAKKGKIK